MAALLEFPALGQVLRDAAEATATSRLSPVVHLAHRLCAFTAARIGNVVETEWAELNLETTPPKWTIPRRKMKARDRHHDHVIILPESIAHELRAWRQAARSLAGNTDYVCIRPANPSGVTP
jgi:hypothetical protein